MTDLSPIGNDHEPKREQPAPMQASSVFFGLLMGVVMGLAVIAGPGIIHWILVIIGAIK